MSYSLVVVLEDIRQCDILCAITSADKSAYRQKCCGTVFKTIYVDIVFYTCWCPPYSVCIILCL